jgi:hypothetical protein
MYGALSTIVAPTPILPAGSATEEAGRAQLDADRRYLAAFRDYTSILRPGLYQNTRLTQAESLKRVGDYGGALDMYLRVAWLDQNGSNNAPLFDGKPSGKPSTVRRFHCPGIVHAIAQGANSLKVDFATLRKRFMTCCQREIAAISSLKVVIAHEAAWAYLKPI